MNSKHRNRAQSLALGAILMLVSVTGLRALTDDGIRLPVVRFIEFYIAAQRADVPEMKFWERILYGLAIAKTPEEAPKAQLCDQS